MSNGIDLDMFNAAYDSAVKANARGDIAAAKKHFARAAEIMERLAESGDASLKASRKARADKLKYISQNLTADGDSEKEVPVLEITVKPEKKVSFDDVIGLSEAKAAIHRLLIDPLKNPEAYAKYGLKAGGFILLEGPPGTGKTMFARAAASELDVPFADVNANALVDSYIGKTGKNIDKMFNEARALAKKTGTPVVLFIDEIDSLAQRRGSDNKTAAEAVPTLIKQMDGFSTGADDLVIIAATNIKETLDPAIISRFRNTIYVPLPDENDRREMFRQKLKALDGRDLDAIDLNAAAKASDGLSGRDIEQVTLEIKNSLAARDAGITPLCEPLGELMARLIKKRKA